MKTLAIIKYILEVVAVGLLFVDWKMAIGVFILASIIHTIPLGPNVLLNTIAGYFITGGIIYIFIDWKIGITLIVVGFLVTKFHVWGNKKNFEYYGKMIEKLPPSVSEDFQEIVSNEINRLEKEGRIKSPYHKFVLQTESMALVLWFLRWSDVLPIAVQEEIFNTAYYQYLAQFKSAGLGEGEIKELYTEFEEIYPIYDKLAVGGDFTKIGTSFAQSISEATKTDLDVTEITIPLDLIEQTKAKLNEYHKIMKE